MKLIFAFLVLGISFSAGAGPKTKKRGSFPALEVTKGIVPKAARVRVMSQKKRAEVVRAVRNFAVVAEEHRIKELSKFKVSYLDLTLIESAYAATPFRNDEGNCKYDSMALSRLSSDLQAIAKSRARNQCVMGGYMICLTLSSNRLLCSSNQGEFQTISSEACGAGKVACRSPLFMQKEDPSKTLCVKKVGGSVTQSCINEDETLALSAADIANKFSDTGFSRRWDNMAAEIRDYCKNAHTFDGTDCASLETRLGEIESKRDTGEEDYLETLKGKVLCEGEYGIPNARKMKTKISYTNDGKMRYQIGEKGFTPDSNACTKIDDPNNTDGETWDCVRSTNSVRIRKGVPVSSGYVFRTNPLDYLESCDEAGIYGVLGEGDLVDVGEPEKSCSAIVPDGTNSHTFSFNAIANEWTYKSSAGGSASTLGTEDCIEGHRCVSAGNYKYDFFIDEYGCHAGIEGKLNLNAGSGMEEIRTRRNNRSRVNR